MKLILAGMLLQASALFLAANDFGDAIFMALKFLGQFSPEAKAFTWNCLGIACFYSYYKLKNGPHIPPTKKEIMTLAAITSIGAFALNEFIADKFGVKPGSSLWFFVGMSSPVVLFIYSSLLVEAAENSKGGGKTIFKAIINRLKSIIEK